MTYTSYSPASTRQTWSFHRRAEDHWMNEWIAKAQHVAMAGGTRGGYLPFRFNKSCGINAIMDFPVLHRPPHLQLFFLIVIFAGGLIAIPLPTRGRVPRVVPPGVVVRGHMPRRQSQRNGGFNRRSVWKKRSTPSKASCTWSPLRVPTKLLKWQSPSPWHRSRYRNCPCRIASPGPVASAPDASVSA